MWRPVRTRTPPARLRRQRRRIALWSAGVLALGTLLAWASSSLIGVGKPDWLTESWAREAADATPERIEEGAELTTRQEKQTVEPRPDEPDAVRPSTASSVSQPRPLEPLPVVKGVPWLAPAITPVPSCSALVGVAGQDLQPYLLHQALERGRTEFLRGNLEKAQMAFCEARFLGDTSPPVLWNLTQVLLLQGDPEKALEVVDRMLEQHPGDTHARELRGDVLIRLGRVEAAQKEWLAAAGAPHASELVITNLLRANRLDAQNALLGGDGLRADRMLRRVVALDPTDAGAAAELAGVLSKMGQTRAARLWLAYAAGVAPSHPRVQALQKTLGPSR